MSPLGCRAPFGYGQERYLWTFMATVGMFLAGALFAIGFGAHQLLRGEGETSGFAVAYAVLGIAFVAEGISWVRAPSLPFRTSMRFRSPGPRLGAVP